MVEAMEATTKEPVEAETTITTDAVDSGASEVASEDHSTQAHHNLPAQGVSHHSPQANNFIKKNHQPWRHNQSSLRRCDL